VGGTRKVSVDDRNKWQDYASCNGVEDQAPFFDDYESDVVVAIATDQLCQHCPVAKQCLEEGTSDSNWGVWGGLYLVYGKIDKQRNSHKTDDDWRDLERIHGHELIRPS